MAYNRTPQLSSVHVKFRPPTLKTEAVPVSGRPIHRFADASADGTIGFFQTIGRWISLKKHRFSEKMAERNLV